MDSINKFLGTGALLAVTLAAGIYIVRNGPTIDFKQPAPSTPEKPAAVAATHPVTPATVVATTPKATTTEAGFELIFNGHDLTGWTGKTADSAAENGSLVYRGPGKGNLYTTKEYGDFHLRFDYKLSAGADNGIGILPLKPATLLLSEWERFSLWMRL